MQIPPSPHFDGLDLRDVFNCDRADLPAGLASRIGEDWSATCFGKQAFRGIGFDLGEAGRPNVVFLSPAEAAVTVAMKPRRATWFLFLHAVADRLWQAPAGFGPTGPAPEAGQADGNELGGHVADYAIRYADGTHAPVAIQRRFGIQQRHIPWSASPFEALPARGPFVSTTASEDAVLGRAPSDQWGRTEMRHTSGRLVGKENLWLYALPNPHPDRSVAALLLRSAGEACAIYGIASTALADHPLRTGVRRKLRLTLPPGVALNAIGELDADSRTPQIAVDLGAVVSARQALDYDPADWNPATVDAQPRPSQRDVIVEFVAHPAARMFLDTPDGAVEVALHLPDAPTAGALPARAVAPTHHPVTLRIRDSDGLPLSVRLHLHGAAGEYLPPRGHHRKVNAFWFEDNYGELLDGRNQYAYVPGECIADLPLGTVYAEISCGFEMAVVRSPVTVTPETHELRFTMERRLDWRAKGWVSADTHVHFLSPQTALLEGRAEGVNVVNLLAAQWGEMFSNVGDFDGHTTFGARDFGGSGEFLVRVGTENRMQVLGHISLLGYDAPMIGPLSADGPGEAAIGDPLSAAMADWAAQCRRQDGLVVMPHAPNPQAERAADIVLGLVDAIEMMTFNPRNGQVNPHGLADWYRYLNLGYLLPLVAGSDKMAASSLLGGIRTYARLGDEPFTYHAWKAAVRRGNTFVTVGPLVEFQVEGVAAGGTMRLPAGGGRLAVHCTVESATMPFDAIELVVGGETRERVDCVGALEQTAEFAVDVRAPTWMAIRVRGSRQGIAGEIAAHTSAVQVLVDGATPFIATDAQAVLDQIEGSIAYVDTLATGGEGDDIRRIRRTLRRAHSRLHRMMHRNGIMHIHDVVTRHDF